MGMQMLINMIIRPPRAQYPSDLSQNNTVHKFGERSYTKRVFIINNGKGEKLSCLFYEPVAAERPAA